MFCSPSAEHSSPNREARGSGLDGLFGGRAEAVRGLAYLPYAGGIAGFHRRVGEKPIKGVDSHTLDCYCQLEGVT